MAITYPFPFNDTANVTAYEIEYYRPYDESYYTQGGNHYYWSKGLGCWRGTVTGDYDGIDEWRKIDWFLHQYADGRPFTLDLSYLQLNGSVSSIESAYRFTLDTPGTKAGQHYISVKQSDILAIVNTNNGDIEGWDESDYFSINGQLFQAQARWYYESSRWRIPLFPNVKFPAQYTPAGQQSNVPTAFTIQREKIQILARLDMERASKSVAIDRDEIGLVTIPWIASKRWGSPQ